MAIAMRLRNQLQSVYKLDPLRNEVSTMKLRRTGFYEVKVKSNGARDKTKSSQRKQQSKPLSARRSDADGERAQ